eukprot:gene4521-7033_t
MFLYPLLVVLLLALASLCPGAAAAAPACRRACGQQHRVPRVPLPPKPRAAVSALDGPHTFPDASLRGRPVGEADHPGPPKAAAARRRAAHSDTAAARRRAGRGEGATAAARRPPPAPPPPRPRRGQAAAAPAPAPPPPPLQEARPAACAAAAAAALALSCAAREAHRWPTILRLLSANVTSFGKTKRPWALGLAADYDIVALQETALDPLGQIAATSALKAVWEPFYGAPVGINNDARAGGKNDVRAHRGIGVATLVRRGIPAAAASLSNERYAALHSTARFLHTVVPYRNGRQSLHVLNAYAPVGHEPEPVERREAFLSEALAYAASLGDVPMLLLGDLNTEPSRSVCLHTALQSGRWADAAAQDAFCHQQVAVRKDPDTPAAASFFRPKVDAAKVEARAEHISSLRDCRLMLTDLGHDTLGSAPDQSHLRGRVVEAVAAQPPPGCDPCFRPVATPEQFAQVCRPLANPGIKFTDAPPPTCYKSETSLSRIDLAI